MPGTILNVIVISIISISSFWGRGRGWLINNQRLFLMVLKAQKSKNKELADLVSAESPLPGSQMAVFSWVVTWQKELSALNV